MSQQNIDFGTFPDDPDADAIRTAFQKVQQNFDEIYDSTANAAVLSVNRSQGAGITVNGPTGNVIVSANIASVQFSSVTLKIGTSPSPTTNTASYTNYSQTLYIEIPDNLSVGNITANGFISATGNLTVANANLGNLATANFFSGSGNNLSNIQGANVTGPVDSANTAGTVTTNAQPNITSVGNLTSLVVSGNITPTANITYDLGNNTNRFKDIYLANSTIYLGNATVQANANALILTNPLGGQLVVSGNSVSYSNSIVNGNSNVDVSLNGNVTVSVAGNANVFTVTGTGANVNGPINSLDANLGNAVTANYFIGSGANLTNIPSGNVSGQVGNALVAGTVYTAAQPNITSLGTVTSLSISGNANIGNVGTGGLITATGNITGGNLVTGGALSVTGDANVGNIGANNGVFTSIAGTLTTAAQPNVTSTGTLASLSVSGNANIGNIGTGLITATGNITGGNLVTGGLITATGNITGGNINTSGNVSGSGNVIGGNLTTGGLITATGDITGGNLLTTGSMSVGGNANVGNIGATNAVFTSISGTLSTNAQPNITSLGTLSNLSVSGNATITNLSVTGNLNAGDITVGSIANGNSNVDITNLNGNVTISVDSNNIAVFTTAGAHIEGILISDNANLGNAANANYFIGNFYGTANTANTAGTVTTNSQPNITSLGNLATLTVIGNSNLGNAGNVYIGGGAPSNTYLTTDGSGNLSWSVINNFPPGGSNTQIQFNDNGSYQGNTGFTFNKTTGAVAIPGNLSASIITGTLASASNAQPNITSVGSLISLALGGNLNSNANIVINNASNIITGGSVFANSGTVSGNLLTGTLTTNAQPNITSIGTLTSLSISGTLTAGNLATVGTLSVGGNANVGNIGASDGVFTTLSGNGSAISSITGANVTGTVANATYAVTSGSATTAGTVTTNSQPNITSLGTLSSLSVSGNANVGNIGATNGVFTNVSGNGSALTSITGANVTGAVSFATTANAVAGANVSGAVSFATTANAVAGANVSGAVSFATTANAVAGANVSGQVGNALVAGTVYTASQSNITAVGTLTSISVSGNANIGNIGTGGLITATGNITGGNLITGGLLTVTGNVQAANVIATTYNITGVATGISAAGSSQGDATALTKAFNVVSTVSGGQGVVLPTAVAGMRITVVNTSGATLLVYPASGGAINALATNAGYSLPTLGRLDYIATSTTQWYAMGAIYV